MALTFSSDGARSAANELTSAANTLDQILNGDLTGVINQVKGAYDSETAQEIYAAFDQMKAKFPDFIQAISDCSNYLNNKVAPEYEKLEAAGSSAVNG